MFQKVFPLKLARFSLCLLAGMAALAGACSPHGGLPTDPAAPATATPSPCPAGQAPAMVWPQLSDVEPQPAAAGATITVTGSGGYVACGANGINESDRSFGLELDGAPVGSIACYINHCEAKFTLPAGSTAGRHVVAAQGGAQMRLDVR